MQRRGFEVIVFERAEEVGGTWRDNVYPGCACDVPSHLYSLSFATDFPWSSVYAGQAEILTYLKRVVRDFRLEPCLRLGEEIREARWQKDHWLLNESFRANALVVAVGPLRIPYWPEIPGLETFPGPLLHSAQWEPDISLEGRRAAVVGTGASAVQVVPALLPQVAQLTLFQRSPAWIAPRPDRPFTTFEQRVLRWPLLRWLYRSLLYLRLEAVAPGFVSHPFLLRLGERLLAHHLRQSVKDPQLAARLTPNYRAGCKRILVSSEFYPALTQAKVELVDQALERVEGQELVAADQTRRQADALVLCTGYRVDQFLYPLKIWGRSGEELSGRWQGGPEAYWGTTVADYPNLFMLLGPNTGLGHNSVVFMVECQVHYLLRCLLELNRRGLKWSPFCRHLK